MPDQQLIVLADAVARLRQAQARAAQAAVVRAAAEQLVRDHGGSAHRLRPMVTNARCDLHCSPEKATARDEDRSMTGA